MRAKRWGAVAAMTTATVLAGLVPAAAQVPEDRLVSFEEGEPRQIGALRIGEDVPLARALKAYGRPTRKKSLSRRTVCKVRWQEPGISVLAASLGTRPRRRCDSRRLSVQQVTVSGAGWTTDRGLVVGDPDTRMRELYDDADDSFEEDLFVLEESDGPGGEPTPRLLAKVSKDRVIRLEVFVGAAGD